MSDWRWKIGEAVERIRTRYDHIGRKTGAPFLALLYPPELEAAVLREWRTQASSLTPDFDLRTIDVLAVTQAALADLGAENVVDALANPMPGSDPVVELGHHWVDAVARHVRERFHDPKGRPVVVMERVAALYPVAGPRDVMQQLWDSAQSALDGPVIVLVPGSVRSARTYTFLDVRNEFMYRGDLL